jgi:hypothetical protein
LILKSLIYWLPLAVIATILSGLVYVAVQQDFRGTANDPQIEMAEDAAAQLEAAQSPASVVGTGSVDIGKSLAPYLIVYDDTGKVLASSATLNGQTPDIPPGVLANAREAGQARISWQPQPGVRSATVVQRVTGSTPGFVLAGRSLLEIEKRESKLTGEVFFGWLAALIGGLVAMFVSVWLGSALLPAQRA